MEKMFITAIRFCGEIDADDYNYGEELAEDNYHEYQGDVHREEAMSLDYGIDDIIVQSDKAIVDVNDSESDESDLYVGVKEEKMFEMGDDNE